MVTATVRGCTPHRIAAMPFLALASVATGVGTASSDRNSGHGLPTAVPFTLVTTGVGTASSDRNSGHGLPTAVPFTLVTTGVGTASSDRNSGHGLPMAVLLFGCSLQTSTVGMYIYSTVHADRNSGHSSHTLQYYSCTHLSQHSLFCKCRMKNNSTFPTLS